ncbi:MAG: hypothetical protein EON84_06835 [Bradyrhizobiaceae bacterium]|jgi:hypothetical protein|nr:MAG: hypothetical protein EON84_06835 [Bradyrhizobiaceae bacterium]
MKVATSWPWITLLIAALAALNPVGWGIIDNAWNSGEQLARSLGQFLVLCALGGLAAMGLIEFVIRRFLISRQRRSARGVEHGR